MKHTTITVDGWGFVVEVKKLNSKKSVYIFEDSNGIKQKCNNIAQVKRAARIFIHSDVNSQK